MNTKKLVAALACCLALLGASGASGYVQLTVFGDSLSDGGNDFALSGGLFPPLPYQQRLTNGPTGVEVLAANLGLPPLTPSLLGGRNYAFGGAETGTGNYFAIYPGVPPLINALFSGPGTGTLSQVQSFTAGGGTIAPQGLTVLWAGANDFFEAITLGNNPGDAIVPALGNLSAEVAMLYTAGARTILLPGVPDLGLIPFGLMSGSSNELTALSMGFNSALVGTIAGLEIALPGLDVIPFDIFSLLDQAIAHPGAYGFTNVTDPCFNGVVACANPDEFLFWDTVHPTAAAHRILGNAFTAAVPEPGTLILVAVAIGVLRLSRRRGAE